MNNKVFAYKMGYAYLIKGVKIDKRSAFEIADFMTDEWLNHNSQSVKRRHLSMSSENYKLAEAFNDLSTKKQLQLVDLNDGGFVLGMTSNGGETPSEGTELIDVSDSELYTSTRFYLLITTMGLDRFLSLDGLKFGTYIAVSD